LSKITLRRAAFAESPDVFDSDDEFEFSPQAPPKKLSPQAVSVAISDIFKNMQHKFKAVVSTKNKGAAFAFDDEDAWEDEDA